MAPAQAPLCAEVDARIRTGVGLMALGEGGATGIDDRTLSPGARDVRMATRNHMNDELLGELH